jgi:uncharacterized protein
MDGFSQIINKVEGRLKEIFSHEVSGHDFYHLKRVMNLAGILQKKEGGDLEIVSMAALTHDLHRIIQDQNGNYCQPKDSLLKIREILESAGLEEEKIKKVLHCVEFHEEYPFSIHGQTVKDVETLVLQDADRLDAIGAIGIARAFYYGSATGTPIWNPEIPLGGEFDESKNDLSEIHHFYTKLLKLKDNMNTKTGKKMAGKRHKYMEKYLKEFFKEWSDKI